MRDWLTANERGYRIRKIVGEVIGCRRYRQKKLPANLPAIEQFIRHTLDRSQVEAFQESAQMGGIVAEKSRWIENARVFTSLHPISDQITVLEPSLQEHGNPAVMACIVVDQVIDEGDVWAVASVGPSAVR
jgi:hypothetical protein